VIGKRPQADRIPGAAEHHAKRRELTAGEEAAAVAALRELARRAGLTCWPRRAGSWRARPGASCTSR